MLTSSVHDYYLQDMSTTKHNTTAANRRVYMLLLLCKGVIFTERLRSPRLQALKRTVSL